MKKLLEIQKELGAIRKDKNNPFFNSSYADINTVLEAVKPVLNKHGVVVLQPLSHVEGKPAIRTALVDTEDGKVLIEDISLLPELADAQKAGGAITYFRRYALVSMLALEQEDDDGNVASGKKVKSEKADPNVPPF